MCWIYFFKKAVQVTKWNVYVLNVSSGHLSSLSLDSVDGAVGILVHLWLFPVIILISILSPRRWPYPGRGYQWFTRHWREERVFVNGHWKKTNYQRFLHWLLTQKLIIKTTFFKHWGFKKRHHGNITYSKLHIEDNLGLGTEETFRCFCG